MRHVALLVVVLAVTLLSNIHAQEPLRVQVGDRVRVTYGCVYDIRSRLKCERDDGTLSRVSSDTIAVVIDERVEVIPRESVELLEVSSGSGLDGRGSLIGAGLVGGVGLAITLSQGDTWPTGVQLLVPLGGAGLGAVLGSGRSARKGGVYGFLRGAAAGAVVGAAFCAGTRTCAEYTGLLIAGGAVIFGGGGLVLGALIGMGDSEGWEPVAMDQLRVTFVPQRDGRFALGLSVAF